MNAIADIIAGRTIKQRKVFELHVFPPRETTNALRKNAIGFSYSRDVKII